MISAIIVVCLALWLFAMGAKLLTLAIIWTADRISDHLIEREARAERHRDANTPS